MTGLVEPENRLKESSVIESVDYVSIIVAVQDQKEIIHELNDQINTMLTESAGQYEIIYVDDGSTDGSWEVLDKLAQDKDHIRAIKLRTAFGESSVLQAALEKAGGNKIIFYLSRVRANSRDFGSMLQKLEHADVVVGVRHPRRDSKFNRYVSRLFNIITNRLTNLNLQDINSGVLAVRRTVLDNVPFYGALHTFLPVLAHRQGYRVAEEKVEQLPGSFKNSFRLRDYIRRSLDLISVIFLSRYSKKPLHFLGFLGVVFTLIGAFIDSYLFFYRILGFGGIAGRPMLLLGTVLLVIGLQMIAIGLLAEMIIFTHARNIREYNIEEIIE